MGIGQIQQRSSVKMHTLLDLRGSIPANIHITDGKWHDSNELDMLTPEPFAFYVMDKAYVDFKALLKFHQSQAFWVSRPKENMKFMTVEQMEIPDAKSGILEDSRIRVTGIGQVNSTLKTCGLYEYMTRTMTQ